MLWFGEGSSMGWLDNVGMLSDNSSIRYVWFNYKWKGNNRHRTSLLTDVMRLCTRWEEGVVVSY